MNKHEVLKKYFGHDDFREGQADVIDNILDGKDVLAIMPTGAGKSICYQVPAMLMSGITLVVSPLISLMKDQVNSLVQSGISAAYLNSSLTGIEYNFVMQGAYDSQYKILYITPERLMTDEFLYFSERIKVSMLVVDEAHCVSQWGQNFRPSYLKIVEFVQSLSYRPIVSAFTATATREVREDIAKILRLDSPFKITTGFDRKNLYFVVQKPNDKFAALAQILNHNRDKSGIIYCISRKNVEEVCDRLYGAGFSVTRYHAGLSSAERQRNQENFIFDRSLIMVATNAFGMGIDKSNVSFVVHYNMPKDLESYYQEAGRAGRDGERAECILLYSGQDVRTNRFLINMNDDNEDLDEKTKRELKKRDEQRLKQMTFYSTTSECLRCFILKYFGEKVHGFCGNCSNCNTNFESVDVTVEAQKLISCVFRLSERNLSFGKTVVVDIVHGSKNEKIKRFNLESLSTYGIMADISTKRAHAIIDYLIVNEYLQNSDGEYPTIELGGRSAEVIRQKKQVVMRLAKEKETIKTLFKSKTVEVEINSKLYENLKQIRLKLAKEIGVPAYVVFHDSTLRDVCVKMPKTKHEFLTISGIGERKAEKYWESFTKAIVEFKE